MINTRKKIYILIASNLAFIQKRDWFESMPELNIIAEVEVITVFNENSSDTTPKIWLKLVDEITKHFNQADGFVVLHDIDNILYTASALSFLLQNLSKPVIITGPHQKKGDGKKSEIRANIVNACQAASYHFGEVALMLSNRLLRANQSTLSFEETLNIFNAPPKAILGRIDFSIRIFEKNILNTKGKLQAFNNLNTNVEIIEPTPLLDLKYLSKKLTERDGVIVKAGHNENLAHDLLSLLNKFATDKPIIIWTGQTQPSVIIASGLILINRLTWEATLLKLMWALTQNNKPKKIKELMLKDLAGETIE